MAATKRKARREELSRKRRVRKRKRFEDESDQSDVNRKEAATVTLTAKHMAPPIMNGLRRARKAVRRTLTSEQVITRRRTKLIELSQPPRLLLLPAELRNIVYELILIEENADAIPVDDDLTQPLFRAVCRQIRHEALPIWYMSNEFLVNVDRCEASLLDAWVGHCCDMGFKDAWVTISQEGPLSRPALRRWCKAIWEGGRSRMVLREESQGVVEETTALAHEIAEGYKQAVRSWSACLAALSQLLKTR